MLFGPTFAEMRDPSLLPPALRDSALQARAAPAGPAEPVQHLLEERGRGAAHRAARGAHRRAARPIVVLSGPPLPDRVAQGRAGLLDPGREAARRASARPGEHTLVFPSTGNYGIGGAWVGPRMGYRSLVVLPEEMSAERFEKIRGYGAEVVATPGSESNVKEIYDKVKRAAAAPANRVLNQFEEFGNYRFHYHCTGDRRAGGGCDALGLGVGAFVSAMGSAGTIAAGEALKAQHPGPRHRGRRARAVPDALQRRASARTASRASATSTSPGSTTSGPPTCWCAWTTSSACWACSSCRRARRRWPPRASTRGAGATAGSGMFGISGVCNVLGAIKTARYYGLGPRRTRWSRWPPTASTATRRCCGGSTDERGPMDRDEARRRAVRSSAARSRDWILEGTRDVRRRWHNQKYFTWVEQQGKTVDELRAQEDPAFWIAQQERAAEIDRAHPGARASDDSFTVSGPPASPASLHALRPPLSPRPRRALPALRPRGRAGRGVRRAGRALATEPPLAARAPA